MASKMTYEVRTTLPGALAHITCEQVDWPESGNGIWVRSSTSPHGDIWIASHNLLFVKRV